MDFRDWIHTPTPNNNNTNNHKSGKEEKQSKSKWRRMMKMMTRTSSENHIPSELVCPITNSLMSQPVIVSSGHTFELAAVQLCINLAFTPTLSDGSVPDFSTLIPNLALRSTIHNFCAASSIPPPISLHHHHLQAAVLAFITAQRPASLSSLDLDLTPSDHLVHSSSHEYATSFCSSENEIVDKLRSVNVGVVEEAVTSLRNTTRSFEASRILLCTPRLLSVLKSLVVSRYPEIQANAVAAVVNLSLEKMNKVKILRSGVVPPLIDILKAAGLCEAQEHACSALFSLALDDANKTAIGVLGALQPLLVHALQREPIRTQNDAAWALYHLSLAQSNRVKMVKLGAVQSLLSLAKYDHVTSPVFMLILCNLASCAEGRAAMLDAGAVGVMVSKLGGNEVEICMDTLYELSHRGGLRFKIIAKEAGLLEVLRKLVEEEVLTANERVKYKARKVMKVVMDKWEEIQEDVDWEELIDLGLANNSSSHF
ncbi:hypothetical protein QQ045_008334 [Rhodiola kirilowii]